MCYQDGSHKGSIEMIFLELAHKYFVSKRDNSFLLTMHLSELVNKPNFMGAEKYNSI